MEENNMYHDDPQRPSFCQHLGHNTLNNRWLAYSQKDTPRVMQTKFSKTMMVFWRVSCVGDVMPPHFFREGLRLNSDAYVELLITVIKPWITRVANGRPFVWQQDLAPCHTWKKNGSLQIFLTTPVPLFGLRTPQIITPWIIMYVALLRKIPIAVPVLQKHS